MRHAKKEPFPVIYVDAKEEGAVSMSLPALTRWLANQIITCLVSFAML